MTIVNCDSCFQGTSEERGGRRELQGGVTPPSAQPRYPNVSRVSPSAQTDRNPNVPNTAPPSTQTRNPHVANVVPKSVTEKPDSSASSREQLLKQIKQLQKALELSEEAVKTSYPTYHHHHHRQGRF